MNPSSFALLGTGAEDCTHGRTRTKERQRLITDFPDSNRFHRLLLFDYALCPQRARTITLWYGTPVGFGRAKRPEVVPNKDHPGSLGVESSALREPIRGIRFIREIRDELLWFCPSVRAAVRACPEERK